MDYETFFNTVLANYLKWKGYDPSDSEYSEFKLFGYEIWKKLKEHPEYLNKGSETDKHNAE